MANNNINLSTLDASTIKQNLKNYLKNQSIFRDFDFDGSNMSVLLDVLSYNTAMQAFYINMLAGESFLDSAQLRSSVISHAKELNYHPRSAKSAYANVRLKVTQSNSDTLVIPKGTTFSSTYNSKTYTFSTDSLKSYSAEFSADLGAYVFQTDDIAIYEGFYITESFVMDYSQENQRFILSNENIDTSSLVVTSVEDSGSIVNGYLFSDTLLGMTRDSKNYFIQATENSKYEIIFGDDILGRRPPNNSTIIVQYRVASGSEANGCNKFVCDSDLTSDHLGRIEINTTGIANGGSEPESISSVKYNAPRYFQTQERAVTTSDYESLLKTRFPEISAISVYGGETLSPPQYGNVFISLNLSNVDIIPESKRIEYTNYIKPRMPSSVNPVFVDPTYLYARILTTVKYNLNITTLKPDEIRTLVLNKILNFDLDNIEDFNSTLYYSKLVEAIDEAHTSVISNTTDVVVFKKVTPLVGQPQSIDILFSLPIKNNIPQSKDAHSFLETRAITSSSFTYNGDTCILEDDGVGSMRIMKIDNNQLILVKTVGTVNYDTGAIQINNFNIDTYDGSSLRMYAISRERDITSSLSDIFRVEPSEIIIKIEDVRE